MDKDPVTPSSRSNSPVHRPDWLRLHHLDQDESNRFITLEPGIYKQDDENKKRIYPNVFSRATGQPFLCVSSQTAASNLENFGQARTTKWTETELKKMATSSLGNIWNPDTDLEDLPEAWLRRPKSGPVVPIPRKSGVSPASSGSRIR